MIGINAQKMVQEVRKRIHDLDSRVYDDATILAAGDDACRSIWDLIRTCNEGLSMDRLDITAATFTPIQTDAVEYVLPFYVGDIQEVEGLVGSGSGNESLKILRAGVEDKDVGRHDYGMGAPRWLFSRGQSLASIQVRGGISGVHTIRLWFIRSWAPLCLGNDEEVQLSMLLIYGSGSPSNPGLKYEFEQRITQRTSGEPRRITNSRMYGR